MPLGKKEEIMPRGISTYERIRYAEKVMVDGVEYTGKDVTTQMLETAWYITINGEVIKDRFGNGQMKPAGE